MSHVFQKSCRAAAMAFASAAALGTLGASTAEAASHGRNFTYQCKFPLIGTQPVHLQTTFDLPDTWPIGEPTAPFPITAKLTLPPALQGYNGLHSFGFVTDAQKPGKGTAIRARVNLPDGTGVNVRQPLDFQTYAGGLPLPQPFSSTGTGALPPLTLDVPGVADIALTELVLNMYALRADGTSLTAVTVDVDIEQQPYADLDGDPNTFNTPCKLDPAGQSLDLGNFELVEGPPPNQPPTKPAILTASSVTPTYVNLRWSPSTDPDGTIDHYNIYQDGVKIAENRDQSNSWAVRDGLAPDTSYEFSVEAVDNQGLAGPRSDVALVRTRPAPAAVCSEPLVVTGGWVGNTVVLNWTPPAGTTAVKYEVWFALETAWGPILTTTATTATLDYFGGGPFTVRGRDAAGNPCGSGSVKIPYTPPTTPPTTPSTVDYAYALKGSTTLKTLTKGTLQLSGGIAAKLTLATGAFTADLTLNDTSGRLVAAGFLPVTAKIGFSPSGKTTGTLLDGVLKTSSKVRIKVKEVKLFGAIPLAGGNNCQTKNLSDINLQSTEPEFKPLEGGPIAGTYKISDLNGCGPLGGLVSPLTAGGGNTISLSLAPLAP